MCCQLPNLSTSQQTTNIDSYTASKGTTNSINFGFANLSEFTSGKSSIPGAKINFGGGAGLSPGFIQVLPVEDNANKGSFGQNDALAAAGSSYNNKIVRNSSPSPNLIFGSTQDYTNDRFDKFESRSQFAGPQYLPPIETVQTRKPVISTYQPIIPTTQRPIVTYQPHVPSESIISFHTNPPFVPSTPKPFTYPSTTRQPVTFYQPKPTTAPNQYLPPSTPKPFVFTTKAPVYTFPPSTPKVFTIKPYSPPSTTSAPIPQPTQTVVNRVTSGYKYPTPTPIFEYPKTTKQPYVPVQTVTVNKYVPPQYIPPKTSTVGYQHENNAESSFQINNNYITPSTRRPISTNGYVYSKPTPAFTYPTADSKIVTNRYVPPVTSSTSGYSYYTPSSTFTYPPTTVTTPRPFTPSQYLPPDFGGDETKTSQSILSASCAAALRCVPLEYCNAQGIISQTPVVLTKEQAEFRVPTTVSR